jgi:hypothetical protein
MCHETPLFGYHVFPVSLPARQLWRKIYIANKKGPRISPRALML